MLNLLLSTLAMMGLTFLIGFFVAAVIKFIAMWADSLDFYSTHHEELQRLKKLRKLRQKAILLVNLDLEREEKDEYDDKRIEFKCGVNNDPTRVQPSGYYHGVSHGASRLDLMDYYYPENDTRVTYLRHQEQMMNDQKDRSKKPYSHNKK